MGSLRILREKDKIWVINILPIEMYLTSVISSEMSAKSSLQLLKSHAIISRSWLKVNDKNLNKISNKKY